MNKTLSQKKTRDKKNTLRETEAKKCTTVDEGSGKTYFEHLQQAQIQ